MPQNLVLFLTRQSPTDLTRRKAQPDLAFQVVEGAVAERLPFQAAITSSLPMESRSSEVDIVTQADIASAFKQPQQRRPFIGTGSAPDHDDDTQMGIRHA